MTEPSELARTLQSLALGKKTTRVLLKRPMGKEVVNGDRFTFNVKFVSDRIRFRINQLQQDLSVSTIYLQNVLADFQSGRGVQANKSASTCGPDRYP